MLFTKSLVAVVQNLLEDWACDSCRDPFPSEAEERFEQRLREKFGFPQRYGETLYVGELTVELGQEERELLCSRARATLRELERYNAVSHELNALVAVLQA